ncbi:hypothetical protein JTS93_03285 [Clostridium botulinum]|nr:hypothetical protein [Clostridium botulinum]
MVASPKINYYCNLGIDIKSKKSFYLSKNKGRNEKFIGADSLEFLSLIDMEQCLNKSNICTGCFDGSYANY